jgi:hypothetical protein
MKRGFAIILLIILYFTAIKAAVQCRNGLVGVTTLDEEVTGVNCEDTQVCYTTCNKVFPGKKCPGTSVAIAVTDSKLYLEACAKRSKDTNDSINKQVDSLKFVNSLLKKDNPSLYQYFVNYVTEIRFFYFLNKRSKDWCQASGTREFEDRQNEYLRAFETNTASSILKDDAVKEYQRKGIIDMKGKYIGGKIKEVVNRAVGRGRKFIGRFINRRGRVPVPVQPLRGVRRGRVAVPVPVQPQIVAPAQPFRKISRSSRFTPNSAFFFRRHRGRRVLDIDTNQISNGFLLEVGGEEELESSSTLSEEDVLFFKKLRKLVKRVVKAVVKVVKFPLKAIGKLFKRRKASEITHTLLNNLNYGNDINLL